MKKVAKLVCVSLMTRVVVDENASDVEILKKAKVKFNDRSVIDDGDLEFIKDDKEMPFDPATDVECLNCGHQFIAHNGNTNFDTLGKHCTCPECKSSFNV